MQKITFRRGFAVAGSAVAILALAASAADAVKSAASQAASAASGAADTASSAAAAASSAIASATGAIGSVLPPVIVEQGQTTATAKVGDTVVFNVADPVNTKATSDNPSVLDVKAGYSDGSATFNPGGKATSAGTAKVTLTAPDGSESVVTVTVQ